MKDYLFSCARFALVGSALIALAIAAVAALVAVFTAVAVPFVVLFPFALLTKPAISVAAKLSNKRLSAWFASRKAKQVG